MTVKKQDLKEPFLSLWGQSDDVFQHAFNVSGEVFRNVKNRKTMRFSINDKNYFIKIHTGCGWKEVIKNWVQFKQPIVSAENEYLAIRRLESLKIDTMTQCAFAERGKCIACKESFLVTEELQNKVSLEDFCRDNKIQRMDSSVRHAIINQLADICAKMHFSGLCHRDCYLCHFLLDIPSFQSGKIRLFVLDLHRAGIWKKLPRHYQIKDTAGIFFSSMDAGFSKRDALRFMARYSLHGKLDQNFWNDVIKTAVRLYKKEYHRCPVVEK